MRRAPVPPRLYRSHRHAPAVGLTAKLVAGLVFVLLVAWTGFSFFRSSPAPWLVLAVSHSRSVPGPALVLSPPLGAEEAVALGGIGPIAISGAQSPTPIASLTKIMSGLVVLHDHPLDAGASGPNITVTAADVENYRLERSQGDSVVAVRTGEQLSELQALEASLIPSGDNVIQLLASWDAGNSASFTAKMNALARTLGLRHTHYAGPSGVDPATVSTAADQLRLAEVAMANPVFAGIVGMAQVSLPVAGVLYNVNADLGSNGINGVKTGWIPESGGCFVFSAADYVKGREVSVLGAVLGEQGATPIPTVLSAARKLVVSTEKTIRVAHLAAGSQVATLTNPDGPPVSVVATADLSLLAWSGARAHVVVRLARPLPSSIPAGSQVATLIMTLGAERRTVGLRTTSVMQAPSFGWRLTHF